MESAKLTIGGRKQEPTNALDNNETGWTDTKDLRVELRKAYRQMDSDELRDVPQGLRRNPQVDFGLRFHSNQTKTMIEYLPALPMVLLGIAILLIGKEII